VERIHPLCVFSLSKFRHDPALFSIYKSSQIQLPFIRAQHSPFPVPSFSVQKIFLPFLKQRFILVAATTLFLALFARPFFHKCPPVHVFFRKKRRQPSRNILKPSSRPILVADKFTCTTKKASPHYGRHRPLSASAKVFGVCPAFPPPEPPSAKIGKSPYHVRPLPFPDPCSNDPSLFFLRTVLEIGHVLRPSGATFFILFFSASPFLPRSVLFPLRFKAIPAREDPPLLKLAGLTRSFFHFPECWRGR